MFISSRRCVSLFGAPAVVTHQYYVPSYQPTGQAARSKRRPHCARHDTHSRSHSRGEFYVAGAVNADFLFPDVCVCVCSLVRQHVVIVRIVVSSHTDIWDGRRMAEDASALSTCHACLSRTCCPYDQTSYSISFEMDRIKQKISKRHKKLYMLTDFSFSLEVDQKH